jgi:hypothetical protein
VARGIEVSDEEVNAAFEKEDAQEKAVDDLMEGMESGASHEHMHGAGERTRQELMDMRENLMITKLLGAQLSDEAIRKYYDDHINEFKVAVPLVRYEIVGIDAAGETAIIEKVRQKAVKEGTTLREALASMEDAPPNVTTFTTPLSSLFHIVPEMRAKTGKLKTGEIAEPFHMNANGKDQYIVVRVVENTDIVPFENIKEQLRGNLLKSFVDELHKRYDVVLHEEMLNYQVRR